MDCGSSVVNVLDEVEKLRDSYHDDDAHSFHSHAKLTDSIELISPSRSEFDPISSAATPDSGSMTNGLKNEKKRTWRKPMDKPKRPLSAYNLFFQLERERIISGTEDQEVTADDVAGISLQHRQKKQKRRHRKTHGKISFADLARTIADKWKKLDPHTKGIFNERAAVEKERYRREIDDWNTSFKAFGKPTPTQTSSLAVSPSVAHPVLDDPAEMTSVPDVIPAAVKPHAVLDDSVSEEIPPDDSQAFMRYQGMPKMDNDLLQARMEHMEAMMAYNRGQGPRTAVSNNGGNSFMMSPMTFQDTSDYYEIADHAYNMAHMTLPMARARQMGAMKSASVAHHQQQLQQLQMQQQQMQMELMPSYMMPAMAMQPAAMQHQRRVMMPMGMRNLAPYYYEMDQYVDHPMATMAAMPQQHGMLAAAMGCPEDLSFDPHHGLSSPSFEAGRDEVYGLRDSFEG